MKKTKMYEVKILSKDSQFVSETICDDVNFSQTTNLKTSILVKINNKPITIDVSTAFYKLIKKGQKIIVSETKKYLFGWCFETDYSIEGF